MSVSPFVSDVYLNECVRSILEHEAHWEFLTTTALYNSTLSVREHISVNASEFIKCLCILPVAC